MNLFQVVAMQERNKVLYGATPARKQETVFGLAAAHASSVIGYLRAQAKHGLDHLRGVERQSDIPLMDVGPELNGYDRRSLGRQHPFEKEQSIGDENKEEFKYLGTPIEGR